MDAVADVCPDLIRSFDACGDPVFMVNDSWTIIYWNQEAEEAFGQRAADVCGKPCYQVIAGVDGDGRELCRPRCERWALARRGARIRNFEMRANPTRDVWLNVSILPITDPAGRTVALAHIARNIERAKRLERFAQDLVASGEQILAPPAASGASTAPTPVYLTARELEVLGHMARGSGTTAIAATLGVSKYTVHNHIAAVLNKLGVHSRGEAIAYAFQHHLV